MPTHKYEQRLNISVRLWIAFGVTLAYTLILFAVALSGERKLYDTLGRYDSDLVPSSHIVRTVLEGIGTTRRHESEYVVAPTSADMAELDGKLRQDRSDMQANLQSYRSLASDTEDRANYEALLSHVQQYFQIQEQVLALSRNRVTPGQHELAVELLLGESRQAFYALNDTAMAWAKYNEALTVRNGDAVYRHSLRALITMMCFVLLNVIVSCVRISSSITQPLGRAVGLAKRVASGDLTQHVEVPGTDEVCVLLTALNDMSSRLSGLITDVLNSAGAVAATAGEIARRNEELHRRIQQQAASLEETATSMDEITSLGRGNSDNARNADQLAQQARELAESGGSVVGQAVEAMSVINQSSAKISDIISVIDDIAFQTNLLALNAAVEAARAGDQGRGFAVVASEVRELAQRSADAAKRIKALIIDSSDKVRVGNELVDRSGQALSQILNSVREMTKLIKEIANASREQAVGVQRVNEAILHLDQATQQNVAWVADGSAASHTLLDQAHALFQRASFFTVEQGIGQ